MISLQVEKQQKYGIDCPAWRTLAACGGHRTSKDYQHEKKNLQRATRTAKIISLFAARVDDQVVVLVTRSLRP